MLYLLHYMCVCVCLRRGYVVWSCVCCVYVYLLERGYVFAVGTPLVASLVRVSKYVSN